MKPSLLSKLIAWSVMFAAAAPAAPGDLDTAFAGTGTRRIGFGGGDDRAHAVAVQADGKLVMAGSSGLLSYNGSFSLARLDTNNLLDASFGEGGVVLTPVSSSGLDFTDARVNAVRIQTDGKIVAAGYATTGTNHNDFTLVRYHPDGSLDMTFGTNGTGIVYTDFGEGSVIQAMVIQADGRIVVVGHTTYSANAGEGAVALARYQTNGTLDVSFGSGGKQITTGITGYTGAHGMMIQSDGKIVAVGIGIGPFHNGVDFALYRYATNGILDSGFGGGTGQVFTQISTNNSGYRDSANAVATQFGNETIQNPDKIVVAGSYDTGYPGYYSVFALARYNLNGTLDTTFGNGGIVTNRMTTGSTLLTGGGAVSLVVEGRFNQPRKITVGGSSSAGSTNYFTLARYTVSGAFDTTFGTNGSGIITIPFAAGVEAQTYAMALQSGKFVLAGYKGIFQEYDFAAARFNSNGSRDTNFANGGVLTVDIANLTSVAKAVVIQSDGKTVVAGSARHGLNDVIAVGRFKTDGSLDASFGFGGKVTTPLGAAHAGANAVVVQPDGKLVVAGFASNGANDDFAVLRYNTNGTLDASFGTNGIVITPIGTGADVANAITLQADGKVVVAGNSYNGANDDFAVVRYRTNGTPDTSFDGDGKVTTAIATGTDFCQAVKVQADGKIVVGGYTTINAGIDFAMVRYNTNGALDNSFGSFGRVATDIGSASIDASFAMAIQPNGRILLAGYSANGANVDVALVRYTTNGIPDTSFDGDGKVTTPIGLATEYATAMALQPDGKIVVAGVSTIGAHSEFAAVRYNIDGSLDGSYGSGGKAVVDFNDGADNTGFALALDSMGRAVIAGDAGSLFGVVRLQGDPFLKIISITHPGNGTNLLTGVGIPGGNHTVNASATLNTGSFVPLGPVAADATGLWQYEDRSLVGTSNRFYRLSYP